MAIVVAWIAAVVSLICGAYGAALAVMVPILERQEPPFLENIGTIVARANALPGDLSRSIGHVILGAALAAFAMDNPPFKGRTAALVLLALGGAGALLALMFLAPIDTLAGEFIGGKELLNIVTRSSRLTLELSATLICAAIGLKLIK